MGASTNIYIIIRATVMEFILLVAAEGCVSSMPYLEIAARIQSLVKMILLVLLMFISVSSSQEQTPECSTSNAALAAHTSCQWAVGNITLRTFSVDQYELVCNDSECNNIYRSYVRDCFPVSLSDS